MPSGAAGGKTERKNPAARMSYIGKRDVNLTKGERYEVCESFIALFNGKERVGKEYVADRDITLTEYFSYYNEPYDFFIDLTDASVVDTFIETTHEEYKRIVGDLFGSTIPLIFTDEPGIRFGFEKRRYPKMLSTNSRSATATMLATICTRSSMRSLLPRRMRSGRV